MIGFGSIGNNKGKLSDSGTRIRPRDPESRLHHAINTHYSTRTRLPVSVCLSVGLSVYPTRGGRRSQKDCNDCIAHFRKELTDTDRLTLAVTPALLAPVTRVLPSKLRVSCRTNLSRAETPAGSSDQVTDTQTVPSSDAGDRNH